MSREIDLDNLSEDDIIYLADRSRLPEGVDDPRLALEPEEATESVPLDTEYTGDEGQTWPTIQVDGEEVFSEYEDMNVTDLKDELRDRGLSTSGTKAELVARLEESDQAASAAPAE
jgi:hypothetical protein